MSTKQQMLDALSAKPNDFVEAVELVRDGMVESRHRVIAALTRPDGKLVAELGHGKRLIYARSALKPLQAIAMRRAGLLLSGPRLAITVASHHGTAAHQALVREVLAGAGLDEQALQCPVAWPGNASARAGASEETRLAFNCSGKHAGFLAAAKAAGWSTENYLAIDHPLQKLVAEVIQEYTGEPIVHTTIDGCGAPLHTTTVEGLARATVALVLNEPQIVAAMLENPWVVGDQNTPDAILMRAGFVSKLGAEGVLMVGTADGHGIAVKVADGAHRASSLVALRLLREHDLVGADAYASLWSELAPKVLGGDRITGEYRLV